MVAMCVAVFSICHAAQGAQFTAVAVRLELVYASVLLVVAITSLLAVWHAVHDARCSYDGVNYTPR